jgi:putative nucleotidyltransferase with HDIG domain
MTTRRKLLRRLKLRHVLLVLVLLSSTVPLLISSALLIPKAKEVLQDAERDYLTRKALALSREIDTYLVTMRRQLTQLGSGLLLAPRGPGAPGAHGSPGAPGAPGADVSVASRLHEPWVDGYLRSITAGSPDLLALSVLDPSGEGPRRGPGQLPADAETAMKAVFEQALGSRVPAYRFVSMGAHAVPNLALAVPVSGGDAGDDAGAAAGARGADGPPRLVALALLELKPLQAVFQGEQRKEVGVFLLDRHGQILWSDSDPAMARALMRSELVRLFVQRPMNLTREYEFLSPRGRQKVLAQVTAIPETSWGVVVQKPLSSAYAVIDQMVLRTALATLPLMALSALFAFLAARWVGRPIQRLTETTHEIAAGSFGGRVEMKGLSFELADLADDFNRMSGQLGAYVQQLREAAQANRDLFIGSLRAFAAAIDAKDPYTRGHSERVAAVSRTIARHLLLAEDVQHKVWIGALLHDVGKIGVEDTILRKEGELTAEEYRQMKMHTAMGAEIMQPIEQLREMIPAIRWHHEAWNGRGYPDGLRGEQIPLFARIVAVADTFDAITTNRPYQQAANLQFAVETITKLTGSRFDAKVVTAFLRAVQSGELRPTVPREVTMPEIEARAAGRR